MVRSVRYAMHTNDESGLSNNALTKMVQEAEASGLQMPLPAEAFVKEGNVEAMHHEIRGVFSRCPPLAVIKLLSTLYKACAEPNCDANHVLCSRRTDSDVYRLAWSGDHRCPAVDK